MGIFDKLLGKQTDDITLERHTDVAGIKGLNNYQAVYNATQKGASIVEMPKGGTGPDQHYNVVDENYKELYDGDDQVAAARAAFDAVRTAHIKGLFNSGK